jgi:hypothetical protein
MLSFFSIAVICFSFSGCAKIKNEKEQKKMAITILISQSNILTNEYTQNLIGFLALVDIQQIDILLALHRSAHNNKGHKFLFCWFMAISLFFIIPLLQFFTKNAPAGKINHHLT